MNKTQFRICVIHSMYNKEWFSSRESTLQLLRSLRRNDKTQAAHFTKKFAINVPFKFRATDEFEATRIFDLMTCYIEEVFGVKVSEPAKGRGRGRITFSNTMSHPLLSRIRSLDSDRPSYEDQFDWGKDKNDNPILLIKQLENNL